MPDQDGLNVALGEAAISPSNHKAEIIYYLYKNEAKIQPNQDGANQALIHVAQESRRSLNKHFHKAADTVLSGIKLLMSPLVCNIFPDRITMVRCYYFLLYNARNYATIARVLLVPPEMEIVFKKIGYEAEDWEPIMPDDHPITRQ